MEQQERAYNYIVELIKDAKNAGKGTITIRAGDVHKALNFNNRMPSVCNAMRLINPYTKIRSPNSGYGSNLELQYSTDVNLPQYEAVARRRRNVASHTPAMEVIPVRKTEINPKISFIVEGYKFNFITTLDVERDNNGIKTFKPASKENLNKYGEGPFCYIKIGNEFKSVSGVYLWVIDKKIIYVGQAINFKNRFKMGYASICERNCQTDGQSTNCKMNNLVYNYYKDGKTIDIYFMETPDYDKVERELICKLNPPLNRRK